MKTTLRSSRSNGASQDASVRNFVNKLGIISLYTMNPYMMYGDVTLYLYRQDLGTVLASNNQLDVKDLLKALQLTVDFEAQLAKRFEKQASGIALILCPYSINLDSFNKYKSIGKDSLQIFEKSISTSFHAYLHIYIDAEDRLVLSILSISISILNTYLRSTGH